MILDNLIDAPKVSYNIEQIVSSFARKSDDYLRKTIFFFKQRYEYEKTHAPEQKGDASYFFAPSSGSRTLGSVYAENPKIFLDCLYDIFMKDDNKQFIYLFFDFLFTEILDSIQEEIKIFVDIPNSQEKRIEFILSLLQKHDHDQDYDFIWEISEKIINLLSCDETDRRLLNFVKNILNPSGCFVGDYATADAYDKVCDGLKKWEQSESANLRLFAQDYLPFFERKAQKERENSEDELEEWKYKFEVNR